jgi:hypothetical protein
MKVSTRLYEETDSYPDVVLNHLFNGTRCIYCNWAYYQIGADYPCEGDPEDRIMSWTFEDGRNDMVAWERNEWGPESTPVELDDF